MTNIKDMVRRPEIEAQTLAQLPASVKIWLVIQLVHKIAYQTGPVKTMVRSQVEDQVWRKS